MWWMTQRWVWLCGVILLNIILLNIILLNIILLNIILLLVLEQNFQMTNLFSRGFNENKNIKNNLTTN
jgi:hypothetical protein